MLTTVLTKFATEVSQESIAIKLGAKRGEEEEWRVIDSAEHECKPVNNLGRVSFFMHLRQQVHVCTLPSHLSKHTRFVLR